MNKMLMMLVAVMFLAGCATQKQWVATGGSRADATVKLSYEYGEFEAPVVDEAAGQKLAELRCKTWGYTGAEAFGGVMRQCNYPGGMGGCARYVVTKEYQCTGRGDEGALIGGGSN